MNPEDANDIRKEIETSLWLNSLHFATEVKKVKFHAARILDNLFQTGFIASFPTDSDGAIHFEALHVCLEDLPGDASVPVTWKSENFARVYFNQSDCADIIKTAVSSYLYQWMVNDKRAMQNINSFVEAGEKFVLKGERTEKRDSYIAVDKRIKAFRAAEKKWQRMAQQVQIQADSEHSYTTISEGEVAESRPYASKDYSFLTLRFLQILAKKADEERGAEAGKEYTIPQQSVREYPLDIFNQLWYSKDFFDASDDRERRNSTLRRAYMQYRNMIDQISAYKDREYTVACIQLHQMESAFRFLLADKITRGLTAKHLTVDKIDRASAMLCWNRMLIQIREGDKPPRDLLVTENDVMQYDKEVKAVVEAGKRGWNDAFFCGAYRVLAAAVIERLCALFPPEKHRSWETKDFTDVARFYKEEYKIVERTDVFISEIEGYKHQEFPKTASYYGTLRAVYALLIGLGLPSGVNPDFNKARENVVKARKKPKKTT